MSLFIQFITLNWVSIPFYAIWLAGIIYALVYRHKHPRTSLYAGIALGIQLIQSLFSTILTSYIQTQFRENQDFSVEMIQKLSALTFCSVPFSIASWILLLIAVFGWKNISESESVKNSAR